MTEGDEEIQDTPRPLTREKVEQRTRWQKRPQRNETEHGAKERERREELAQRVGEILSRAGLTHSPVAGPVDDAVASAEAKTRDARKEWEAWIFPRGRKRRKRATAPGDGAPPAESESEFEPVPVMTKAEARRVVADA